MRVTNNMLISTTLENINRNARRVEKASQTVSSGMRIAKPADDPVAVARALQLRSDLRALDQYRRNIDAAKNWILSSELGVRNTIDVLHRARELGLMGANGALSPEQRKNIAAEVRQLFESVIELANAKVGDQYVFAGHRVNTVPFASAATPQGYVYQGDSGAIQREIGVNTKVQINTDGAAIFGPVLQAIKDLEDALLLSDSAQITSAIGALDGAMNTVLSSLAEVGARATRLDLADERLQDLRLGIERELSHTQDADMAAALIEQTAATNVYHASLKAGAQVVQPSLLDYLR